MAISDDFVREGMYYDRQGKPILSLKDFIKLSNEKDRVVARTELQDGAFVSTVWMGINHRFGEGPPLIFETMAFEKDDWSGVECRRYATEAEAKIGHEEIVKLVKERKEKTPYARSIETD